MSVAITTNRTANVLQVLAVIFTAVSMSSAMAHLFALPNKINMSLEQYYTVQRIYDGWHMLGFVLVGALLLNTCVAVVMRQARRQAYLAAAAAMLLASGLTLFLVLIEPVNQQHANGIPENWRVLRTQWEYGHAANAGLHLLALVAITLCVVRPTGTSNRQ